MILTVHDSPCTPTRVTEALQDLRFPQHHQTVNRARAPIAVLCAVVQEPRRQLEAGRRAAAARTHAAAPAPRLHVEPAAGVHPSSCLPRQAGAAEGGTRIAAKRRNGVRAGDAADGSDVLRGWTRVLPAPAAERSPTPDASRLTRPWRRRGARTRWRRSRGRTPWTRCGASCRSWCSRASWTPHPPWTWSEPRPPRPRTCGSRPRRG